MRTFLRISGFILLLTSPILLLTQPAGTRERPLADLGPASAQEVLFAEAVRAMTWNEVNPAMAIAQGQNFATRWSGGEARLNAAPGHSWSSGRSSIPHSELYGVVSAGTNRGALIRVDVATGDATIIHDTGLEMPQSLTYDGSTSRFLVQEGFGQTGICVINETTGDATPLGAPTSGVSTLAFHQTENLLYGTYNDFNFSSLFKLDPATGSVVELVNGQMEKGPIGAIAVNPTDGKLYGVGYEGGLSNQWLFTIRTTSGGTPLETEIALVNEPISALAFDLDGSSFATDGSRLLKINIATGATEVVGGFGSDIGIVSGLAFKTIPPPPVVNLWIKDCVADLGNVPSAPKPCRVWWTSPDIWIDNDGDPFEDPPIPGIENRIYARVRNAGDVQATDVRVRFYYWDAQMPIPRLDDLLIGKSVLTLAPRSSSKAMIRWVPPASIRHNFSYFGVRIDHPDDHAIIPPVPPPSDNNFAVKCIGRFVVAPGGLVRLDLGSCFGSKNPFGFRGWNQEYMFEWDSHLPAEWSFAAEGFDVGRAIAPEAAKKTIGSIRVNVPANARPHSSGTLSLFQIDVKTREIITGLGIVLKVDPYPPEAPRNLRVVAKKGGVLLSWDPVIWESQTHQREHIGYYDILRDGRKVAQVVEDIDPASYGFQWEDHTLKAGAHTYAIRAVDEGGNASKISQPAKVGGK